MITQPHFEELLKLLEENRVEYAIVGGYAVAFYGYPRFTKDMDIFYRNSTENIRKIRRALICFGFSETDLPVPLFEEKGNIIQFGITPLRVDMINEIDGVKFDEAKSGLVRGKYGDVEVSFIGLRELIKNKLSSGRDQDQIDAKNLTQKEKEGNL